MASTSIVAMVTEGTTGRGGSASTSMTPGIEKAVVLVSGNSVVVAVGVCVGGFGGGGESNANGGATNAGVPGGGHNCETRRLLAPMCFGRRVKEGGEATFAVDPVVTAGAEAVATAVEPIGGVDCSGNLRREQGRARWDSIEPNG